MNWINLMNFDLMKSYTLHSYLQVSGPFRLVRRPGKAAPAGVAPRLKPVISQ
jgi:hypothetical protein